MPYLQAFRYSLSLFREQGFSWLVITLFTTTFAFFYCPGDHALDSIMNDVSKSRNDVLLLVKQIEQLESMLHLVEHKDPFTMERLIREEFRLKRNKPSSN